MHYFYLFIFAFCPLYGYNRTQKSINQSEHQQKQWSLQPEIKPTAWNEIKNAWIFKHVELTEYVQLSGDGDFAVADSAGVLATVIEGGVTDLQRAIE